MERLESKLFHNEECEHRLLGYIASKGNQPSIIDLIDELTESDFYDAQHAQIFSAMQGLKLEKKPVDFITVAQRLTTNGAEGLDVVLSDCMRTKECNTEFQARQYVQILKDTGRRRKLFSIFEAGKDALMDGKNDLESVFETARKDLHDMIAGDANETLSNAEVLRIAYDHIERVAKGEEKSMPTGLSSLDKITKGFHRGELTIIGARPAVGKSALGMHIANATAAQGYNVLICSREMSATQLGTRELARGISFSSDKLRSWEENECLNDDEWKQLAASMSAHSRLPITYVFEKKYIEDLRRLVQQRVDENKLDLLIVDYTQLMQTRHRFDADYQRIGYVTKMLKDMTIDFKIAVIALAQVSRSTENNMPTLADLRGSGDIEQDADNVIFMHRPTSASDSEVQDRDRDRFQTLTDKGYQYIVLGVAKQRQGSIGKVPVIYNPNNLTYTAIARE